MALSLTAVTATTTGATTAVTATIPTGVVAGSMVIVCVFTSQSSSTITGFGTSGLAHAPGSPLLSSGNNVTVNVLYKIASGSESGSYSLTASAGIGFWAAGGCRVDGAAATPWDTNSGTGSALNGSVSATSLTTSMTTQAANEMLFNAAAQFNGGTWTQPTSFTKDFTDTAAPGALYFAHLIQAAAGATGTLTTSQTGAASQMDDWLGAIVPDLGTSVVGQQSTNWHPGRSPGRAMFSVRSPQAYIDAIVIQVTTDAGNVPIGLAATGTAKKIAVVAGTCSIGLAATGKAAKLTAQTGTAALGLTETGTATKRAPEVGLSAVGLSATSTSRKRATPVGTSVLGLAGTGSMTKKAIGTGTAALGLAVTGRALKLTTQAGVAAIGFAGTRTSTPGARVVSGVCSIGFAATGSASHIGKLAGTASVGLAATGLDRKISINAGKAAIGLAAIGQQVKRAPEAGRSTIGFAATRTSVAARAVRGTAYLGFALWQTLGGCDTPRPFSGTTTYTTATTSRPSSGTTTYATATTARPNTGQTDPPCG